MAHIKKYSDVGIMLTMPAYRLKGEVRCILRDENLNVVKDTGWENNIITDTGLTRFGSQNWYNYMHIGSNGTAAAFTDNSLIQWLAYSNNNLTAAYTRAGAPNYEFSSTIGKRFNVGVGTGTVRELGLSDFQTNANMSIRCVLGTPIPKAVDQALDVYHRLTVYPNLSDITGQVTIESELYDYTLRPWRLGDPDTGAHRRFIWATNAQEHRAFGGPIISSTTLGDPTLFHNAIKGGYATTVTDLGGGFGYSDRRFFWDLDHANNYTNGGTSSNGILATTHEMNFYEPPGNQYGVQIGWERVSDGFGLNKTETKIINITLRMTWQRH